MSWKVGQSSIHLSDSFCQLEGHGHRVVCLSWSCFNEGQIASASYDGSVQVWDVLSGGKPVANFRGHSGRLYSVQWSTSQADEIFSGAEDNTLQRWNVSEQTDKIPPKSEKSLKRFSLMYLLIGVL